MLVSATVLLVVAAACSHAVPLAAPNVPHVELHNAAQQGLRMPAVGLGTFGYGGPGNQGGEYLNNTNIQKPVLDWLQLGGRRIDGAHSYLTQTGVGIALKKSGVARSELFLTSKIGIRGDTNMSQFDHVLEQFKEVQSTLQSDIIDLLLIHWPGDPHDDPKDSGLVCAKGAASYKDCRIESWKALEQLYKQGKVRAIGVSNFEQRHIEEILELKSLIPSVNQVEFHPYWAETQLVNFCKEHNIHFQSYAPLGAPDHMATKPEQWPVLPFDQKVIKDIADQIKCSPAQVILKWAWQQGISNNPRTMKAAHMQENLSVFTQCPNLSAADMHAVSSLLRQPGAPNQTCGNPSPASCNNKVCPNPAAIP